MDAERQFQRLVATLDYPMVIVTVADGDERAGCLVGFTTQCSIHPPRYLVCLSDKNRTFEVARRSAAMAVHFPTADQVDLARLFGGETGDEIDKFTQCSWRPGPGGVPLLDDCPRHFAGPILERHVLGDHAAYVVAPEVAGDGGHGPDDTVPGLGFRRVRDLDPGHDP